MGFGLTSVLANRAHLSHIHKHNRQRQRWRMSTTPHRMMHTVLHRPEHRGRGQPTPPRESLATDTKGGGTTPP